MPEANKLVVDGVAWLGNVSTSVAIIFINKVLMARSGYGFVYATTLCALHYLACSGSIWVTQTFDSKLLIIPFVCLVERFWLKRTFSRAVILSVAIVVGGVAVVTVTDTGMSSNAGGLFVAGLCFPIPPLHRAGRCCWWAPLLDRYVSSSWVFEYEWVTAAVFVLVASCSICGPGQCDPVRLPGPLLCMDLHGAGPQQDSAGAAGGLGLLGDKVSAKQFFGMLMAVFGMVSYGVASAAPQASHKKSPASPLPAGDETIRLLAQNKDGGGDTVLANGFRLRESEHQRKGAENV
ncbi:hypothetical protein WJX84_012193 [Apatococcus fuscideae]|uniref:Sugar phosphate transporter domain-containing protein n=1 Tax=Apatococcus fuscideae TaxID=2026836 RepID=A0AAW1T4F5_9CHLO